MTSMRLRALLAAALATAFVSGTASAGLASSDGQSGAARSLRIAGAGSVFGSVLITRPVDFATSREPVFRASHPARLDAIVLVRELAGTSAPGVAALNLQSGTLLQRSYAFLGTDTGDQVSGTPVFATRILPAGRYRVMMLSRGPNDVTLTLPSGRSGVARIAATTSVRYAWQELSGTVTGPAATPAMTSNTAFESTSRVLQVGLGWIKSTSAATRFHACSERSSDAVGTALRPTPICTSMAGVNSITPGVDRVDVFQAFHQPEPGAWGFKSVATTLGVPSAGGAVSLQVELGATFS